MFSFHNLGCATIPRGRDGTRVKVSGDTDRPGNQILQAWQAKNFYQSAEREEKWAADDETGNGADCGDVEDRKEHRGRVGHFETRSTANHARVATPRT